MNSQWREAAEAAFQSGVKSRSFILAKVNPDILPGALPDTIFTELQPRGLTLHVMQEEKLASIVLRLETPRGVFEFKIPPLYPMSFWVETKFPSGEMSRLLDQVGKGLVSNQPVRASLENQIQRGKVFYGLVLREFVDGSRSYLSLGYPRRGKLQLTLGMDVPCEDVEAFVRLSRRQLSYNDWEIGQLLTEFGRYCRIPVGIFF